VAGGVQFAPPATLDDLRPLVLGHHPLHLKQKMVLGRLAQVMVDKGKFHPAPLQLIHQQHLICVAAGQAVGAQHVQAVDPTGRGQIAQSLQGRTNQRCAAVAFVDEPQLRLDRQTILRGALHDRGEL